MVVVLEVEIHLIEVAVVAEELVLLVQMEVLMEQQVEMVVLVQHLL